MKHWFVYSLIYHSHAPSIAFGKTSFNALSTSFCCWESPSFIMNLTFCLIFNGRSKGIAWEKTHRKDKFFWFGIQIHKNMSCFPTEVWHENLRISNPLLFEYNVTSPQIASGNNIKRWTAGNVVQAKDMKRISPEDNLLSLRSILAKDSMPFIEDILKQENW